MGPKHNFRTFWPKVIEQTPAKTTFFINRQHVKINTHFYGKFVTFVCQLYPEGGANFPVRNRMGQAIGI
jgi:hypothetical protein